MPPPWADAVEVQARTISNMARRRPLTSDVRPQGCWGLQHYIQGGPFDLMEELQVGLALNLSNRGEMIAIRLPALRFLIEKETRDLERPALLNRYDLPVA